MSKRNRNKFRARESVNQVNGSVVNSGSGHASPQVAGQAAEYRVISSDLIRLVILNAAMLALVLVVYFTNLHSNYLEKIFLKLFKI
jgi:hypothetical protein